MKVQWNKRFKHVFILIVLHAGLSLKIYLGRTDQTRILYRLIYENFILSSTQFPYGPDSYQSNSTFSVGKLVLLNILYHLHELCISLIQFRFTLMSFRQMLSFFYWRYWISIQWNNWKSVVNEFQFNANEI